MLTFHSHFPYILCPLTVPQIPDDLKKRKTNLLATKTVIRLAPDKWYIHVINPTCPLDIQADMRRFKSGACFHFAHGLFMANVALNQRAIQYIPSS